MTHGGVRWMAVHPGGKTYLLKPVNECSLEDGVWCFGVVGVGLTLCMLIAFTAIHQLRQWEKTDRAIGVFSYTLVYYVYIVILLNDVVSLVTPFFGLELSRDGRRDSAVPVLVCCLAFVLLLCALVDTRVINERGKKTLLLTISVWVVLFWLAEQDKEHFKLYWKDFVGFCTVSYVLFELLARTAFDESISTHNLRRPIDLLLAFLVVMVTVLVDKPTSHEEKECNCGSLAEVVWYYNSALVMHILFLSLRFSDAVPQAIITSSQKHQEVVNIPLQSTGNNGQYDV